MTDNVVPFTAGDGSRKKMVAGPPPERPLYPSPDAPLEVARKLYKAFRTDAGRTLVNHRGDWVRWNGQQWEDHDTAHLRSTIYTRLGEVDYDRPIRKGGEIVDYERTRWNPNRHKVSNVLEAMAAIGHLSAETDAPAWIGDHNIDSPAGQVIAATNGLLALSTRTLTKHTPALYNRVSVPFAYDYRAPQPTAWLAFLASVWPDDPASIALLQEWCGYIVSGRTDQQKILFGVGPTRSGKGTIARVLRKLIGPGNVTGPTMASLSTNFGLAPLMGKPLAIIPDARINGPVHTIVERLLSISGEDVLTIDRKNREAWSGKLPTRIMVLSNEIPRFTDASGAIANRLLVLQMRQSFLGKEDRTLDDRLTGELPGILNWALEGLDRLTRQGRFTVPTASSEAATMLMDLASPVSAFVRECCYRGQGQSVARDRLYLAWRSWCADNGHEPGAKATFGRNLAAVVPDLGNIKPRVGKVQIRCYTGIGLLRASPDSPDIPAGQSPATEAGSPASPEDSPQPILSGESGTHASPEHAKAQVTAFESGEAGNSALQTQLQTTTQKISCQKWFDNHIAELRAAGHTTADSTAVFAAGRAQGYKVGNLRSASSAHPDITTIGRSGGKATWDITGGTQTDYLSANQWALAYLAALPAEATVDKDAYRIAAAAAGHSWDAARHAAIESGRIRSVRGDGTRTIWVTRAGDGEGEEEESA